MQFFLSKVKKMPTNTVSLCVIALNEAKYLPYLLDDFLMQTYPHEKTEIILIDSGSCDGTMSLMEAFHQKYRTKFLNIQIGTNPRIIQAAGWNEAIALSTGDVIVRLDAHTRIPSDFTEKNMRIIKQGEYVVGGLCRCICDTDSPWQKTLLWAENSLFGSSARTSRRAVRKQYVKTVSHGAYRREVFNVVGRFNEALLRTEDNEMHYRIGQAGYRILFDPEIVTLHYVRNTLWKMLRQKYGNGFWIGYTLLVCPGCVSLYHLVPFLFVLGIICTTILAFAGFPYFSYLIWSAYALFCVLFSLPGINETGLWSFLLPGIFLLMHVSYGIGTVQGLWKRMYEAVLQKKHI